MPKIFEYFGFIFLFYSNEHEPIHVHVMKDGHEAIFEIILENGELVEIHKRRNLASSNQSFFRRLENRKPSDAAGKVPQR